MGVGIDEARHDGLAGQVQNPGARSDKGFNGFIGADCDELAVCDGERFGSGKSLLR